MAIAGLPLAVVPRAQGGAVVARRDGLYFLDPATGALYRLLADGSFAREVDGVGLSNTMAWTDGGRTLLFGDTLTGVISTFAIRDDGRLGARGMFADAKLTGHCAGSAIDGLGFVWNARIGGSCLIRFGLSAGQIERNPVEGAVLAVGTDSVGTPSVRLAG